MRNLRIKKINLEAALTALKKRGYEARECDPPYTEEYAYRSYPGEDYELDREKEKKSQDGMTGIESNISGHAFHKILKEEGIVS